MVWVHLLNQCYYINVIHNKGILTYRLYPLVKHFCPDGDGNGLFQCDNDSIHRDTEHTELYDEHENSVNNALCPLQSPKHSPCEHLRPVLDSVG